MSEVLKVGVVAGGHEHVVELRLTVDDPDRRDWFGEDSARQFVAGPSESGDVIVAVLEGPPARPAGDGAVRARREPGRPVSRYVTLRPPRPVTRAPLPPCRLSCVGA
jgi:hypothetical protein